MKSYSVLSFMFHFFFCGLHGDTNVALEDLGTCNKFPVTTGVSLSAEDLTGSKVVFARSKVECVIQCINSPSTCSAAYYTYSGECYQLNGPTKEIDDSSNPPPIVASGVYISLVLLGDRNDCDGSSCSENEICLAGCSEKMLASPVCLNTTRGDCNLGEEYSSGRYYFGGIVEDNRDTGSVMRAVYPKKKSSSGLRVIMHMAIRPHVNIADKCNHWYLTFNNNKCSNPENIEQLDYNKEGHNYYRFMDIDGTCFGLDAGDVQIDLVVGSCEGFPLANADTGWRSYRTMYIMEIDMAPSDQKQGSSPKPCSACNVFNYKYYSWNEELDATFDTSSENRLVKEVEYYKQAPDTSLRIKFNAPMSVKIPDTSKLYCGRWFIGIDGSECSAKIDGVIHDSIGDSTRWFDHTRVRTVEGICDDNLPAGAHTIQVYMGRCVDDFDQPTNFISGGFNSPSRLHVEEVRREHKVDAVYGTGQKIYKSLTGYLQSYYWYGLNDDTNDGTLLTVDYTKQYSNTALRLTSTGSHRSYGFSMGTVCAQWFFKIDGSECTNPGRIAAVSYMNHGNRYHHPLQVSGMCLDIAIGAREITYHTAACPSMTTGDSYIGWQSSFYIFVEELRIDKAVTCTGNPMDCGGP